MPPNSSLSSQCGATPSPQLAPWLVWLLWGPLLIWPDCSKRRHRGTSAAELKVLPPIAYPWLAFGRVLPSLMALHSPHAPWPCTILHAACVLPPCCALDAGLAAGKTEWASISEGAPPLVPPRAAPWPCTMPLCCLRPRPVLPTACLLPCQVPRCSMQPTWPSVPSSRQRLRLAL